LNAVAPEVAKALPTCAAVNQDLCRHCSPVKWPHLSTPQRRNLPVINAQHHLKLALRFVAHINDHAQRFLRIIFIALLKAFMWKNHIDIFVACHNAASVCQRWLRTK
jgi:hypothetical protein